MALIWINVLVVYISDDTNNYNVGLSQPNAEAGNFSAAPAGSQTNFPRGWRMRHVLGISTSGNTHTKVPVRSNSDNLYAGLATTFTKIYLVGSLNFNVQGRIGEKRTTKL